jgi:CDP-diacylglycerol pyrophosphatase
MQIRNEEICGSFTVETENHELRKVIISQAYVAHYDKEESYSKCFRLESLDGPVVYKTENPAIFQLANGTTLKRQRR